MSKRDDEPSDMEVGMTTAERRRRRRRGGGLRVPSDNVPRARATTSPPVVAPVPEDPALAMSIAYSFTNDGSEPVPRVDLAHATAAKAKGTTEDLHAKPLADVDVESVDSVDVVPVDVANVDDEESTQFAQPVAPEASSTVIDPPNGAGGEAQEFEMKTREMSAVDLEALGLSEFAPKSSGSLPAMAAQKADGPTPGSASSVEVRFKSPAATPPKLDAEPPPAAEVAAAATTLETDVEEAVEDTGAGPAQADGYVRPRRERIKTVALSDDDLEEVREVVRAMSQSQPIEKQLQADKSGPASAPPAAVAAPPPAKKSDEILSVPDIDIQVLTAAADADGSDTGESIEVEVDDRDDRDDHNDDKKPELVAPGDPVVPRTTTPVAATPAEAQAAAPPRPRPATVPPAPPPTAGPKEVTAPSPKLDAKDVGHPPPTPPAPPAPPAVAHKAPPTPPPAATAAKQPKPAPAPPPGKADKARGKPWFVDLFDEDYLRTLPFLTPQATQAEAEFVIDAMGLQPGAQVLDLGCGYGRHAMELAARGFHMVGLDISTPLLVRGGEEANRRGLTINFVRGDMRELDFDAQFDGAYCLFSTFGYFDDETNKKTVANIARALKPGGRVMIEILNRDYVIADLPTRIWWEGEGCVVLEEVELNYFSSRIQVNRSVVFDDGRQLEQEISVRAYSLHEVGKLMHAAGFRVLEVSGGYQTRGRFFGNQSRHIIVLAERKDSGT